MADFQEEYYDAMTNEVSMYSNGLGGEEITDQRILKYINNYDRIMEDAYIENKTMIDNERKTIKGKDGFKPSDLLDISTTASKIFLLVVLLVIALSIAHFVSKRGSRALASSTASTASRATTRSNDYTSYINF